eukprot:2034779-Prymnesium_polylepis.1
MRSARRVPGPAGCAGGRCRTPEGPPGARGEGAAPADAEQCGVAGRHRPRYTNGRPRAGRGRPRGGTAADGSRAPSPGAVATRTR